LLKGTEMTGKTEFAQEEWDLILEAPPTAALIVMTADRGGTFRESFSMAKAYTEARQRHGDSELLDEVVSTKPKVDRARAHSPEELRARGLEHLREAVAVVERKATPEELEDYRRFVLSVADRVANAHREGGQQVSDAERAAIEEIAAALGTTATQSR
jgi:hypothetical protein